MQTNLMELEECFEPINVFRRTYKAYNDGNHYVGIRNYNRHSKVVKIRNKPSEVDNFYNLLFKHYAGEGLVGNELYKTIKKMFLLSYPNYDDEFFDSHFKNQIHNFSVRKKRFERKAKLNKWNYFCTFTYDSKKFDEDTFKISLKKTLANFAYRRGWKYMGVWERGSDKDRLHFHALFYIPKGEMIEDLKEITERSSKTGEIHKWFSNTFFQKKFGRNEFDPITEIDLKFGGALRYIQKYLFKTQERIAYSRGIVDIVYVKCEDEDIVSKFLDFTLKYVFFDDVKIINPKDFDYQHHLLCLKRQRTLYQTMFIV